eukprot:4429613-Amphidinium_carterae.1
MDVAEPANPTPISELVEHLTSSSTNALQQVEILRVNVQRQQMDISQDEVQLTQLHQEYRPSPIWKGL